MEVSIAADAAEALLGKEERGCFPAQHHLRSMPASLPSAIPAVDTSVLLGMLLNEPWHSGPSIAALWQAANEGPLITVP